MTEVERLRRQLHGHDPQAGRATSTPSCAPAAASARRSARGRSSTTVFEAGLGYRKAIYTPFPQAVPKYPGASTPTTAPTSQKGTCKACEKFCPTGAIDFDQQDEEITVEVGNIILATGFELFDARRVEQYGYGRLANVFTSLEFERMSNAAGPTAARSCCATA